MKTLMNCILVLACFCLLTACASKYSVARYDNDIFEVMYSAEGEGSTTMWGKLELLAAYEAERKGCDGFDRYHGISQGNRSGTSMGILSSRQTIAQVFQCVRRNNSHFEDAKKTREVIQIYESRYGSLRNMERH